MRNAVLKSPVFVIAALLLVAGTAAAATFGEYTGRVRSALAIAIELDTKLSDNSINSRDEFEQLDKIRQLLPESEKVDMPGGVVETDNRWLHELIADAKTKDRIAERQNNAKAISERLAAIEFSINEVEKATEAKNTKDEDKRKLAEILNREEYRKPEPKESLFQRWVREFFEWLGKLFPESEVKPAAAGGLPNLAAVLQVLLYVLIIAGIGFLLYKLLPFFSDRFKRKEKREKRERVILGERIGDDESSGDIFAEAERLAASGELRLAIRKAYIALLCDLADRRIIGLARHKTNRDYLRDIRERPVLLTDLRGATGEFERHWYGHDAAGTEDWHNFRELYGRAVANAGEGVR